MIRTIAGNGRSGSVPEGTPALSAPLGPVASIAFSPNGELYLTTSYLATSQLFRLTPTGLLDSLQAILPTLPRSLLKFSGGHSSFRLLPDRTLRV
jgi:hypothetical protein